ncbi:MAG TPA: FmdB family zinc ribbon protein [bacterium]|nr:FmdB family zinc ribbon protein [bacterium]
MTYVFQCKSCGQEFEITATVAEYESRGVPACPSCGAAKTKRVFTPVLVMVGAGAGRRETPAPSSGGCGCGGACSCGH